MQIMNFQKICDDLEKENEGLEIKLVLGQEEFFNRQKKARERKDLQNKKIDALNWKKDV